MKTSIRIPKFLHELFGIQQQRTEFIIIVVFAATATLLTFLSTSSYWLQLKWYQTLVLWLLFFDISGGVVANLSTGTNEYYNYRPKSRWIFIAVHIQPLILAAVLQSHFFIAFIIWSYTIASASLINILREKVYHRLLAGALCAMAIIIFILSDIALPLPLTLIYLLYMLKVVYCFSVNHTGNP
ncbi:MAG TPA: hypothetical protein DEF30_11000 [Proteiniclasticum sp.]|uniref:Uncharacterized protein n=1 Tax=Proteiniclasticum ruminis TaxID=398199 RepID=A0A1I5D759_9CLOT|nr:MULTISPECIES: hypothetical protein [Proteiniclasticum]SFN94671.1 hypothetical protein SAMN04488695_10867 [Proteiniclasticum ruminis]HBW14333.1 hypothetical protein [Proteiniclasticum sp.]